MSATLHQHPDTTALPRRRATDRADRRIPGIPIRDSRQVVTLLQYFADRADYGDLDVLLEQMHPKTLDTLRRSSTGDLMRLAEQQPPFLAVCIDEPMLKLAMNRLHLMTHREETILWYIRRGAHAVAMLELFGMQEMEYRRIRNMAAIESRRGRTPKLVNHTLHQVKREWYANRLYSTDQVERFKALCEAFPDISFSALWSAIKGSTNT
jgi:hypothetical protein